MNKSYVRGGGGGGPVCLLVVDSTNCWNHCTGDKLAAVLLQLVVYTRQDMFVSRLLSQQGAVTVN